MVRWLAAIRESPGPSIRTRLQLALCGGFGGLLPEIVNLYQKRDAPVDLSYLTTGHYIALTAIYLGSAAIVAAIFPYRGHPGAWRAMLVGVALPTLIGTGAGVGKVLQPEVPFAVRGADAANVSLLDLLALF
jgi:hypothetical protein